ncbi:SEC-C metal-binding domain-containing protein [Ewingella americana]
MPCGSGIKYKESHGA